MYKRKTEDEYQIHGLYNGTWEEVTCESTYKDAKVQLRCYQNNEPNTAFKIVKRRVRIKS